jgi:hypothetical protein
MMTELLLPAEAAKLLRVSVGTLRDWRYRRTGPDYIKAGTKVLYDVRDLERYRDAQRAEAIHDD